MLKVFLYGLFMDSAVLSEMGIEFEGLVAAELQEYRIEVGRKAGLVPDEGATSYGVLVQMSGANLERLYSTPGVEAYKPVQVRVKRLDTAAYEEVICYNISAADIGQEKNRDYAGELAKLARRLNFPSSYVAEIESDD